MINEEKKKKWKTKYIKYNRKAVIKEIPRVSSILKQKNKMCIKFAADY